MEVEKKPDIAAPKIPILGINNKFNKIFIPVTTVINIGAFKLPRSNKTI